MDHGQEKDRYRRNVVRYFQSIDLDRKVRWESVPGPWKAWTTTLPVLYL